MKHKNYLRKVLCSIFAAVIFTVNLSIPHTVISEQHTHQPTIYFNLNSEKVVRHLSMTDIMANAQPIPTMEEKQSEKVSTSTKSAKEKSESTYKESTRPPKKESKPKNTMTVTATAYCGCEICNGEWTGYPAADGSPLRQYHTIAAWEEIPFGTKVYIPYFKDAPNSGIFEVEDRGSAITHGRIDIYFSSHEKALEFGMRELEIEFR